MAKESITQDWGARCRTRPERWFNQALGRCLLESELALLGQVLPNLFGYHLVQLGNVWRQDLLAGSRISHKLIVQLEADEEATQNRADLIADGDALPLVADGIDVVLAPHVLEFTANPHKLLREIERVIIGDGHLILIGFNPWSLFGLWQGCLAWRKVPPRCGHFYGLAKVRDWLSLLDFEIVRSEKFFYRPPLKNSRFLQKLSFMETLGRHCWSYFASAYLVVAQKRVIPLSPARLRWHTRRSMIIAGLAEPSARVD